jgi:hypothetical protein
MDQEHGATKGTGPVPMLSILQGGFVAYLEHVATHYPQSVSSGSTPSYEALQDFVAGFDPNSRRPPPPWPPWSRVLVSTACRALSRDPHAL